MSDLSRPSWPKVVNADRKYLMLQLLNSCCCCEAF